MLMLIYIEQLKILIDTGSQEESTFTQINSFDLRADF